jgi:tetratricopeptide (TPR) repeat protein
VTLGELLRDQRYSTSAFVGAFVLDARWGLAQGFEVYDDAFGFATQRAVNLDSVQRRGEDVVEPFFDWLEGRPDEPFLSWLHFYDPHTPYDPPEPYRSRFSESLYDGEIAYMDFQIGRVLDRLKEESLLDQTLILVVGDHGESLGEHEESGHGFFIYDATVLVPLIVRFPLSRYGGKRLARTVETVDIVPTLLEALNIPVPGDVQGRSLLPLIRGEAEETNTWAYFETYFPLYRYGWSRLRGIRNDTHKFILAPRPELYHLTEDRHERTDISSEHPPMLNELEARLKRRVETISAEESPFETPQLLDDEALEKLTALGYVGGFHPAFDEIDIESLPDPKDKIRIYNRIREAESRFAEARFDEALDYISRVIEEDPDVLQARQVRAQIYSRQGEYGKAIDDCRAALRNDPEYKAVLFTLAHALRMQGELEEAVATYETLAELDPNDYKPPLNIGRIRLQRGEVDRAVTDLEHAMSLDPERSAMARNLLGAAYIQKGMFDQAVLEIQKAIELRPWIKDAHYNLGLLFAGRGDLQRAVQEMKRELELYPDSYLPHFHLARFYDQTGDHEQKLLHLHEVIEIKDDFGIVYLMLGKTYLDLGRNFEEAIELTRRGLELTPDSEYVAFGHFVLADLYEGTGQHEKYLEEKQRGEALDRKFDRP